MSRRSNKQVAKILASSKNETSLELDRKITLATEGFTTKFCELILRDRNRLSEENALTVCNYIIVMKREINPRSNTIKITIQFLSELSKSVGIVKKFNDMTRDDILLYLDKCRKLENEDPLHKWIGTYNIRRIILFRFFKWLYYSDIANPDKRNELSVQERKPECIMDIPQLKRKEISCYKPSDLWTQEDDLLFLKWVTNKRDRCYHTTARDLSARPHEILNLKIKDVVFKNANGYQYAEVLVNGKTGSRHIPLIQSIPYIKEWLSNHQFADYTTWKGIENKTGIERENASGFVLKELMDNAVDYLETQHNNTNSSSAPPEIRVTIKKTQPQDHQKKLIRIVVSNSNYSNRGKTSTFSKQMLKSIFDFDRYHSSKRNQFKITKGALGDALKEVLCIPDVLAHDNDITDWNHPLKIHAAAQKIFEIHLAIDRINQRVNSKILEVDNDDAAAELTYFDDTKIEVTLPIVDDGQSRDDLIKTIANYFCNYAIFAIHIGFTLEVENDDERSSITEFPQLQTIDSKWKNHSSVHYYKRKQFHDFILGLENNDAIIYNVLYKTFREASNMKKTEVTQITVGQLKHSSDYIGKELRNIMDNFQK